MPDLVAVADRDDRRRDLDRELRPGTERVAIVEGADAEDQQSAEQEPLQVALVGVALGEEGHRDRDSDIEPERDGDASQERHVLAPVHLPLVGPIDHLERARDARDQRRRHVGDSQRREGRNCDRKDLRQGVIARCEPP